MKNGSNSDTVDDDGNRNNDASNHHLAVDDGTTHRDMSIHLPPSAEAASVTLTTASKEEAMRPQQQQDNDDSLLSNEDSQLNHESCKSTNSATSTAGTTATSIGSSSASTRVFSRTNHTPPIMAFFRSGKINGTNRWWNTTSNDTRDDNTTTTTIQQQPQSSAVIETSMSYESTNRNNEIDGHDSDLTSSLLPNHYHHHHHHQMDDQEQRASNSDRFSIFLHWIQSKCICMRDIILDPYTYEYIRQVIFDSETYEYIQRTIRRSGNYIAICTLFTMLILVPIVLYRQLIDRKLDLAAINSARVMVIGTIIMSFRLVYLHLTHWFMPDVQKYVVRILWMVPIYAIQSYLSLRYHHARVYMSTIRDFYEAFVITSFVYYLMELLGGQESLIIILQRKDQTRYGHHKFPISLVLEPWIVGEDFLLQCKHGVLQYVVFKTTATILIFVCEYCGVYGEGHFEWFVAYPYICFFQNFSVMYALYCLVKFFHACNEELHYPVNWHPLGKFLCIKGVVFFTWWQGVIIFYLRDHGIIGPMGPWSSIDVANGFIDYCIVVEMVGFAIAHSYTFTYTEYLPGRFPNSVSSSSSSSSSQQQQSHAHEDSTTYLVERNAENDFSQALLSTTNGNVNGDCSEEGVEQNQQQHNVPKASQHHYRPPATLPEPMRFRDALWSSTVPRETIQDIQRLRMNMTESVMQQHATLRLSNRAISLPTFMNGRNNTQPTNDTDEQLTTDVVTVAEDPELEHPLPEPEPSDTSFI